MSSEQEILTNIRKKRQLTEDYSYKIPYEWYSQWKKHLQGGPHPGTFKSQKIPKSEINNFKSKDVFITNSEWTILSSKYKKPESLDFAIANACSDQSETPKSSPAEIKLSRDLKKSSLMTKTTCFDNVFSTMSTIPSFKRSFSTMASLIQTRSSKSSRISFYCEGDFSMFNCCLQIFLNITQLSDFFIDKYFAGNYSSRPLSTYLAQLFITKTMIKSGKIDTSYMKNYLVSYFPQFADFSITDLFRLLIDELTEEYEENDFISKQIFNGKLLKEVTCLVCGSNKDEELAFNDLTLEVCTTLDRSFEIFNREDRIQCFCSKCKELTNSSQRLTIVSQPNVLILQLKRFVHSPYLHKNNLFCEVQKKMLLNETKFELKGVVHHEGEIGSGVFVYYSKVNRTWVEVKGKKASKISFDEVLALPGLLYVFEQENFNQ